MPNWITRLRLPFPSLTTYHSISHRYMRKRELTVKTLTGIGGKQPPPPVSSVEPIDAGSITTYCIPKGRRKQADNNAAPIQKATTARLSHGNMFVLPAHKRGRGGKAETRGPTGDYLLNTYRCVSFNGCLLSGRLG